MIKKIFAFGMAMISSFALALSVSAATYRFSCKTEICNMVATSRSYQATTEVVYGGNVDMITAGLRCLRIDTGEAVGNGDFESNNNTKKANAYECIPYSPYYMNVRGFGSHSAYSNGQTVCYEFTQTEDVA